MLHHREQLRESYLIFALSRLNVLCDASCYLAADFMFGLAWDEM